MKQQKKFIVVDESYFFNDKEVTFKNLQVACFHAENMREAWRKVRDVVYSEVTNDPWYPLRASVTFIEKSRACLVNFSNQKEQHLILRELKK